MKTLKISQIKRRKPKFLREGATHTKRLGTKWRYPHGRQSKLRQHHESRGFMPQVGYRTPKEIRGLHPSGFEEFLVYNAKDLEKINPESQAARIASAVGRKKKQEIMKVAEERKIKVLNPLKVEKK